MENAIATLKNVLLKNQKYFRISNENKKKELENSQLKSEKKKIYQKNPKKKKKLKNLYCQIGIWILKLEMNFWEICKKKERKKRKEKEKTFPMKTGKKKTKKKTL